MSDGHADLKPGEHRCPGPSTRDVILADGDRVPDALIAESYTFMGDADIDFARYTSQAFFDREMREMWPRVWQWACREEHIPEIGDYHVYDIGPYSVLVVRSAPDQIKAYRNACMHRATQLRPSETSGSVSAIRCPYHGWTYDLDGKLIDVPCAWDFPHVRADTHSLTEVKCDSWGGFVFINLDPAAPPLADYLAPLPEHLRDRWDLSRRTIRLHVQKELPNNWKACIEAFIEAYHVVETHADYLPVVGDANAQYDVFGRHVSRFVHTQAWPSPHYKEPQTQQQILERMVVAPEGTTVPEGETARRVGADALRKAISARYAIDLSAYSTSEMLDSIEYSLFPNAFFFPGVTLPMVYRFRPIDNDPGRTLFDLIFLRPIAEGETPPPPPEPIRIGVDESYMDVPGMSSSLGHIYDQDTVNLALQWKGFHASAKPGQTLGNYQEIRVRHLHATLDSYLSDTGA